MLAWTPKSGLTELVLTGLYGSTSSGDDGVLDKGCVSSFVRGDLLDFGSSRDGESYVAGWVSIVAL